MNSTNRALNRAVLALSGLLFAIAGAGVLLWVVRPVWSEALRSEAQRRVDAAAAIASESVIAVPGVGEIPTAWIAATIAALILSVALIVFVFARGRGDVREVAKRRAHDGRTDIDRSVVDAVLTGALAGRPDVLSARTGVYLVKGTRTVRLAVTVRQGAALGDVLAAAERGIQDWDSLLGLEIPILIHLTDRGWLDRYRSATRVR